MGVNYIDPQAVYDQNTSGYRSHTSNTVDREVDWYLILNDEKQILYDVEKPRFTFRKEAIKRAGKTIQQFRSTPSWNPIHIEIPTRSLPGIEKWMKSKSRCAIKLIKSNDGNVIEEWAIEGAFVYSYVHRVSRVLNSQITCLIIFYNWARKVK